VIVFYSTNTSPNALRVRLLLEEAAIPHREVPLRRDKGENRTPDFLRISPAGTVPAIVDEETGASVFESMAILLYLADKSSRFLPTPPVSRAEAMKWLLFVAENIDPAVENIYELAYRSDPWVDGALAFQKQKLRKAIDKIDARLTQDEYMAGDCSIVDFALFPVVDMLEDFADIAPAALPNIARWHTAMRARAGVGAVLTRMARPK